MANDECGDQNHVLKPVAKFLKSRKHKISAAFELCKVSITKTKQFQDLKQILCAGDFESEIEKLPEKMPSTPKKGGSNLDWGTILSEDGLPKNNMPPKEKDKQNKTLAAVEKQGVPTSNEKKALKKESSENKVAPSNKPPEPYYEENEKPKNKMPEKKTRMYQKGENIDRPIEASMPKNVIPKKRYNKLQQSASPPDELPPPCPELPTNDIPRNADACKGMCGLKVSSRPIVQPFEKRKKMNDQGHHVGPRAPSPPGLKTSKLDPLKSISGTDNTKLKPGIYNVNDNRRRSTTPPIMVHKYTPSRNYQEEHLINEGEPISKQTDGQNEEYQSGVAHSQDSTEPSSNQSNKGLGRANSAPNNIATTADKKQELTSKTKDALQVKVERNVKEPVRASQDIELQQKAMSPQKATSQNKEINPGSKVSDLAEVQVHKPSIVETKARLSGVGKKLGKRGAKRKKQDQETEDGKPKEIEFEYREEPRLYIKPPKVPLSKELTDKIQIVENEVVPANVPKNYRLVQVPLKPGEVQETYLMKLKAKMQKEAEEKALASKSKAGQHQKERAKSSTSVRGCKLTTQEPPKAELSHEAIAKKKEELKAEALREASLVASKALREVKRIFQNAENKFIPIAKEAILVDKTLKEGVINLIDTMSEEAIGHSSDQNIANDKKGSELVPNIKKADTFSSMNSKNTSERNSEKGLTNAGVKKPPIATSTWDKKQNIRNNVDPADIYTIQNSDHQVPTSIWGEISLEEDKVSETEERHPNLTNNRQTESLQVEVLKQGIYESSDKNDMNTIGTRPANSNKMYQNIGERIPSEQEMEQRVGPEQNVEGKGQQGESNIRNNPNYLARRYGTDLIRNPGPVMSSAPPSLGPPTRPPSKDPPSQTPPTRRPPTSGQGSDDGSGKDPPEIKVLLPSNTPNQSVQATIKVEFQIVQDENKIQSIEASPKINDNDSRNVTGAKIRSPSIANAYVNLVSKDISSRKNKIEMINNREQENIKNQQAKGIPAQRINSVSQNQNEKFVTPYVKETVKGTQLNVSKKQGSENIKTNTQDRLNSIADVNTYYYDAESMDADEKREESARLAKEGIGQVNVKVADEGRVALASMVTEEKKKAEVIKLADAKLKEEANKLAEKLKTEAVKLAEEKLKVEAIKLAEERRKIEEIKLAEENKKAAAAKLAEEKRQTEELKLAEEKKKAEALKLAEQKQRAEALKLAEEKKKAEALKLAEEKKKAEALKLAEEKKKAEALRLAEEKKKVEALKVAEERKKAEALRVAEEQKRAAKKLAEEKRRAEEIRLAEEKKRAEASKLAEARKKAEALRVAEERKRAEAMKLAEEKRRAEEIRLADEKRKAEAIKVAEERRKAEELRLVAEKKRNEAIKLAAELKLAEEKKRVEAARLVEERRKLDEIKATEEKKRIEAIKLAEEKWKAEAFKLTEEKRKVEALRASEERWRSEALKLAEEKRRADAIRLAEEKRRAEEIKFEQEKLKVESLRLSEEKWKTEAIKLAAEKQMAIASKIAEERRQAEAQRVAAEEAKVRTLKQAEDKRKAGAFRKAEDARMAEVYEEKRKVEESKRAQQQKIDEAFKRVEEQRVAKEFQLAEEKRKAADLELAEQRKKAETLRLAAEKRKAEETRMAEEKRKAEAVRQAKAQEIRLADEKKKNEAMKLAEEKRKAEELRLAVEKKTAEALKVAEERKRVEALKLVEEKRRAEEIRLAEGRRKAEMLKIAEQKQKEEEVKLAEEKKKAEAIKLAEEKWKADVVKQAEAKRLAEEIKVAEERKRADAEKLAEARRKAEAIKIVEEQKRMEAIKLAETKKKEEIMKFNKGKTITESVVEKPRVQKFDHVKEDEREVITKLSKEIKDRVVQVTSTNKIQGEKVDAAKVAAPSNKVAQHSDNVKNELQQPTEQSNKSAYKVDNKQKDVGKESSESEKKRRTEALKLTEVKRNAEAIKQAEQRSKAEALKAAAEAKLNEEKRKREELKAADLKKKQEYLSLLEKKRKAQATILADEMMKDEALRSANEKNIGTKISPNSTIRPAYEGVKKSQEKLTHITRKTNSATIKTITPNTSGESGLPRNTSQANVNRSPTFKPTAVPLKDDWTKNLPSSSHASSLDKGIGTFYDWTTPSSLARKAALHMDLPIHQQGQRRLDGMKRDINIRSANKMYQMCGTPCQTNLPKPATPCPVCPDAPPSGGASGAGLPPANAPPSASAPPPPGDLPPRPSSSVAHDAEQVRTGPAQLTGISKYFNSQTISGRANVAKATFAMMGLYALNRMMKKPSKESKPHAKR